VIETELSYEEKRRLAMISGLRKLADFIDTNPDVKLPYAFSESVYVDNTEWVRKDNADELDATDDKYHKIKHTDLDKQQLATVARLAVRAGAEKVEKDYQGLNFKLKIQFSDAVSLTYQADRDAVCTKKVVGYETKEKVEFEKKVVGTEEVEVVEWECDPLLG